MKKYKGLSDFDLIARFTEAKNFLAKMHNYCSQKKLRSLEFDFCILQSEVIRRKLLTTD